MPISQDTALRIAQAYREVDVAETLLADIKKSLASSQAPDIRDGFGRQQRGLQLGVPMGENSQRMYHVEWELAAPIIEAHIAKQKAIITALSESARAELT